VTKRRVRLTFYSLSGLFWYSTALITALYVLFLMEKGLNLAHIGIWAGANTMTVILLEVPTGGLADAWGRGRTFALASLLLSGSLVLMAVVPGIPVLFIGAVLFGAGRALSSGSLDAWFVDALKKADPDGDIERDLGMAGGIVLLALAAGSLTGGALAGLSLPAGLQGDLPPLALPVLTDAGLKIILAVLTLVLIREPRRHESPWKALSASLRTVPQIARTAADTIRGARILPWLFTGGAALALGLGAVESFWQPRFLELSGINGTGKLVFGAVMAACFAGGAAVSMAAPLVTRLLGGKRHWSAFLFTLLFSGSLLMLAFSESRGFMAIFMILCYSIAEGSAVPRRALLNDAVPAEVRATMLSVDSLVMYIGFGGIVGLSFLAQAGGIPAAWKLAAAVIALLAFSYVAAGRYVPGRRAPAARAGILPEKKETLSV